MNRRVLLVFGAIALAAAVLILFLASTADDGDKTATAATGEAIDTTAIPTSATRAPDGKPIRRPRGDDATGGPSDVKEYVVDGKRIRDHRKGDHAPPTGAREPKVDPNNGRELPLPVMRDISGKFGSVLRECSKLIPKDARGARPKLVGSLLVAIKDQQVTVTGTDVKLNDVTGDSVAAAKQCIEQKAVGVSTGAANEADTDRFTISLNLSIR